MSDQVDEMIEEFILDKFQHDKRGYFGAYVAPNHLEHMWDCDQLKIDSQDMYDGVYGCETGCEYARLEVDIVCPHGFTAEYTYGIFGDVADILDDIERWKSLRWATI